MAGKLTQKEATERIKSVHGNEYEYPNFVYRRSRAYIFIVCKIHGPFEQTFDAHVYNKTGCPKCYGNPIIITEIFVANAKAIHGDKYIYTLVEYEDAHTKVKIICRIHGIFEQKPNQHTASKAGCPYCFNRLTTDLIIAKAKLIHGDKYIYSKVQFEHCNKHVEIICPTHDFFVMEPTVHLSGRGCIKCFIASRELTLVDFLARAKEVHNDKYTYEELPQDFKNSQSKVKINCKHHGIFEQVATRHLTGQGCPNCSTYVSKGETAWLDSISVPQEHRQRTIMIGSKKVRVDAYNPETNTIYEFYGDYWHGNLRIFKPDLVNTRSTPHKTMQQLYDETISRETLIKNAGYNLITIWEDDWKHTQCLIINTNQ